MPIGEMKREREKWDKRNKDVKALYINMGMVANIPEK